MFSVLKHDDVAIRSLFCVHCWKSLRLNISNEKQLLSFTSWAHNEMTSKVLQATNWGCAVPRLRIQCGLVVVSTSKCSVITLSKVLLACIWCGEERVERDAARLSSPHVIFLSSANVIVHSDQQKCDFVNVDTHTAKMFLRSMVVKEEKSRASCLY